MALLLLENTPGRRRWEEDGPEEEEDKCRPRPRDDEVRVRSMAAALLSLWLKCGVSAWWCFVLSSKETARKRYFSSQI